MQVNAINSVSSLNFEGLSKRKENKKFENNYPQMDSPASKVSAKVMRDMLIGLAVLGAAATGTTSCTKSESYSAAKAWAWVIDNGGCNCKPDTIFETTPIRDTNFEINDSIISQYRNIGAEVDGPLPGPGKNVILVSGRTFNRYDGKKIEFQYDSLGTNKNQVVFLTKITDDSGEIEWNRTTCTDVPGKGIKYSVEKSNSHSDKKPSAWTFNPSHSMIISNGARGNRPGSDFIYDKDGNMVWQGELTKSQKAGAFSYGTVYTDSDGNPILDENGNPELIKYHFDDFKIWTREVEFEPFNNPASRASNDDYDLWHD